MLAQKSFTSRILRLLTGKESGLVSEDTRRDTLVMFITIMACLVLLGVAAASAFKGESLTALIDFSAGLFLCVVLLVYRFTTHKRACRYVGVLMMFTLYLYLFLTGAAGGYTYMWHYTFPFFAIFLLGANHGALATLCLFSVVFSCVVYDALTPGSGHYTSQFALRFLPSVSVALVFAYLFERERERFRRQTMAAYLEQERIIEERTIQLVERVAERDRMAEELRQSQKLEAIGTMASGVAHDLNNILSGIVTYPELLRLDLPDDSPLVGPLEVIEKSGKRAAAVVSDLLTIARNAASVKEEFDVHVLVRDLLLSPEWLLIADQHPSVSIKTNLFAENSIMDCSQTHIRKSLLNLLVNGFEATSPVGCVTISTKNVDSDKTFESSTANKKDVIISIKDDGPGIASEHLEHIFEPFYSTKRMGSSGSGLGLSVVWNTVDEHEGSVCVKNMERGVLFELRFPAKCTVLSLQKEQPPEVIEDYDGKASILVVDDEPQLRDIACAIVRRLGYSVAVTATGEEAVNYIRENKVDLVLLDMLLGDGISGFETYQRMIEINPGQKAIIVSGYSTSEEVRQTMALGAFSIIKKPYSIDALSRTIKRCLDL